VKDPHGLRYLAFMALAVIAGAVLVRL